MPVLTAAEPQLADLIRALDEGGEQTYRRMLRAARMAHGRFHLFPVESDFSPALRAVFLDRLRDDLAAIGLRLRVVTLTHTCWNVLAVLENEAPITAGDVVMLTGLETTPGIVREPGAKSQRPPALAVLNQMRETLKHQIAVPFFVWCPAYIYTALLEYAPDFFDQYTARFQFINAEPIRLQMGNSFRFDILTATEDTFADKPSFGSQAAVDFYRKQITDEPNLTPERAFALFNLVNALLQLPKIERANNMMEAKACAEEARRLMSKRRSKENRFGWALIQLTLGVIHTYYLAGDQNTNQRQALACYKCALRVFTETIYPEHWALVQLLGGRAYEKLTDGKSNVNLHRAIVCYKAALRIYTEVRNPEQWAQAQFELGWVYFNLAIKTEGANLQSAIACYEEALHIYTETEYPNEWAKVQLCLGTSLLNMQSYDLYSYNKDVLHRAIACLKAALHVYTEVDHFEAWATTTNNLALVFLMDRDVHNAQAALQKVAKGFLSAGNIEMVQKTEAKLQSFAQLSTLPAPSS